MLRCAGCAREVSEWAARCPACRRATDDATFVAPTPPIQRAKPPAPAAALAPRDVEADQETSARPGRRPRRRPTRRAVALSSVAGAAAIAVVIVIALASASPGHGSHRAGATLPPSATAGRILIQDPHGTLDLVDPGTGQVEPAGVTLLSGATVMAAPDRRFVTTLQGAVLALGANDQVHPTAIPRITEALLGGPGTFAANDQAVIVVAGNAGQLRTGQISAVLLRAGRTVALGAADEAAGDPQAVGAFVSLARPVPSGRDPAGGYFGLPDSQVELRDAGQPDRLLATAGQLNDALRQPADRPVHLTLFPNPQGTAVAVVLNPPFGGGGNVGMVVLDRAGTVIGIVPPPVGPVEYGWPAWSPDGRALVYPSVGPSGTALAIWREGGQLLLRTAPDNGAAFGYCLWAPNGSAILCPTIQSARDNWDEGAANGGPLFARPSPGAPIMWLAPAPTSSGPEPASRHGVRRVLS